MTSRFSLATLVALLALAPGAFAQDLTISATAETSSGEAGGRVTLDYTVALTGAEEIEDISVGFYFSTDQTLSSNDTLSEREEVDAEEDEAESDNEQIDIPQSLADGDYFILVVIDDLEQVAETDETNNTEAIAFTVGGGGNTGGGGGANLAVTSVSAEPASGAPGDEIEGEYEIANSGSEQAGESSVGFYLSTDASLSNGDTFLTREDADEVNAGGDGDGDFEFTIPSGTPAGDYFLLAVADDRNDVTETDEGDNVASTPFTITGGGTGGGGGDADLEITTASVSPTSADAGAEIELAFTLANTGNESAGESQVGVYLSTDRNLSSNDQLITRIDGDDVEAGESEDSDEDATVPAGASPGDYFVLFVADDAGTVAEDDEGNNTFSVAFTVTGSGGGSGGDGQADLRVSEAEVEPASAEPGATVETDVSVQNTGSSQAGATRVGIYLSSDNALSNGDELLGTVALDAIDADGDSDGEADVTVPDVTPGDYFLLFVVDDQNDVTESRESNNTRAVAFEVLMSTAGEGIADAGLRLDAAAPNPVAGAARVAFALDAAGPARLTVVDLLGRTVAVLADGPHATGEHAASLDASALAPGVYVLRLTAGDAVAVQTVTVVR